MKFFKIVFRFVLLLMFVLLVYLISAVCIAKLTVNDQQSINDKTEKIYLSSNGIHLSVIFSKSSLNEAVLDGLQINYSNHKYVMFGWGNQDFYLNTPTWNDVKFEYVFGALFLDTPTAVQVTTHSSIRPKWIEVKCNQNQLLKLNSYISNTFEKDRNNQKMLIPCNTYRSFDSFYKATGSYSFKRTCNTWVNDAFKYAGLKASYWTIFDFGLLSKYE